VLKAASDGCARPRSAWKSKRAEQAVRSLAITTSGCAKAAADFGHARALNATSGFCDFQIRIDGAAPGDDAGRAVTGGTNTFGTPVGVTALFSGLAAGSHTVAVFDRGSVAAGGSCDINPGQFPETFLIEEQS
jgi:hypothetical protein